MSVLTTTTRVIMAFCDAYNVLESIDEVSNRSNAENGWIHKASLITRLALLGLDAAEMGMLGAGADNESLYQLKTGEVVVRALNIPIQFANETVRQDSSKGKTARIVEKGGVAPIMAFLEAIASSEAYHQAHYLEMTPEELQKAQIPVYAGTWEAAYVVGYRPVDLEECRRNITSYAATADNAAYARLLTEFRAIKTIFCDGAIPLYERLARFFGSQPSPAAPQQASQQQPLAAQPAPQVQPNPAPAPDPEPDPFTNFLNLTRIPLPLHDDDVFSKFVCPITKEPIRDPVADPTAQGKTLYERSAILQWLQHRQASPSTNLPLRAGELQEVPWVKLVIDERLQHHQQAMRAYFQNLNLPVTPEAQATMNQYS